MDDKVNPPAAVRSTPVQAVQFIDLLLGYQRTQLLYVAAKLGLADLLADGPRPVDELAVATDTHAPSLYRILRALAGFGIFAEREDGRFELTPLAGPLRSGVPGSLRAMTLVQGEDYWRVWGDLLYSVRTGKPAFEHVYGLSNWEYRKHHPEANARFNAFMADVARRRAGAVAAGYPFPDAGVVIDVGGNDGTLLATILQARPSLRGVLFDLPHVVEGADATFLAAGVLDRCQIVGGDFFAGVPEGGDLYLLSAVLHDWGDDRAADILAACRRAMRPGAKLLVIEQVMPSGNDPSPVKLMDILMLVGNEGGRERSEPEWRALLETGGFDLRSMTPAGPTFQVLEALPR